MRIQLKEVHFSDYYSKGFMEFYDKYKSRKYLSDKSLYVQFTNKDNTTDKTFVENPSHNDPSGNYAYPLEYVIKYPADIWYGNNTSHLRVLRKRPDSKGIVLSNIDSSYAMELFQEIGYSYDPYRIDKRKNSEFSLWNSGLWDRLKKKFPNRIKGANQDAKTFWQFLQTDYKIDETDENYENYQSDKLNTKFKIRSSVDQNRILQYMGFDWVEDTSKKDTSAIINDREPEQILFLNRNFDIVDIFRLSDSSKQKSMNTKNPDFLEKELAVKIFQATDDKFSEHDRSTFYSKKGRVISISSERPQSYYKTRNMGQKLHKEFGKYDFYYFRVYYSTEYGEIEFSSPLDATLEEIVLEIQERYEGKKNSNELDPEFKVRSIKIDKDDKDRKREEQRRKEEKENRDLFDKYIKSNEFKENCDIISEYYDIPKLDIFYIRSNLDILYDYLELLSYLIKENMEDYDTYMDFVTNENKEVETKIKTMESKLSYFFDKVYEEVTNDKNYSDIRISFNNFTGKFFKNIEDLINILIYRIEEEKEKLNKKEESYIDILNNYFKE